jgi:hypothetical protein
MTDVEDRLRELLDAAAPSSLSVPYEIVASKARRHRRVRQVTGVAVVSVAIVVCTVELPRLGSSSGPDERVRVSASPTTTPHERLLNKPVSYPSEDYVLAPAPEGAQALVALSQAQRVAEDAMAGTGETLGPLQLVVYAYGTKNDGTSVGPLTRAIAWASVTDAGNGLDRVILVSARTPMLIANFVAAAGA